MVGWQVWLEEQVGNMVVWFACMVRGAGRKVRYGFTDFLCGLRFAQALLQHTNVMYRFQVA